MNRSLPSRSRRFTVLVALTASTVLTVAGCSSSSGGKKSEESAGGVSAGKATTCAAHTG